MVLLMFYSLSDEQAEKWIDSNIETIKLLNKQKISNRYISKEKEQVIINKYVPIAKNIEDLLENSNNANHLLLQYENEFKEFIINFKNIKEIIKKSNEKVIKKKYNLNPDQTKCVLTDEDNLQIIAGAGTGKTYTLVAKVKHLINDLEISPEDILTLSFSKLSVKDLQKKMREISNDIDVSTFHSLGYSLLTQRNTIEKTEYDGRRDYLDELLYTYFEKEILSNTEKSKQFIEMICYYFDIPESILNENYYYNIYGIKDECGFETIKHKLYKIIREKDKLTESELKILRPEKVQSLNELFIANYLFIHSINYTYKKQYVAYEKEYDNINKILEHFLFCEYSDISNILNEKKRDTLEAYLNFKVAPSSVRQDITKKMMNLIDTKYEKKLDYYPTFYLDDYKIYLECFEPVTNCEPLFLRGEEKHEYELDADDKRNIHNKFNTILIEIETKHFPESNLLKKLEEKLIHENININEPNYTEIYKRLEGLQGLNELKNLKKLIKRFIRLFKGNNFRIDKFDEFQIENSKETNNFIKKRTELFLNITKDIYIKYHNYLEKEGKIDYDDMINKATEEINKNGYFKNYRYILVDEYQDTSYTRYQLLKTLKDATGAKLIVVGDDWQSIYQFNGCDISLFSNFKNYFKNPTVCKIKDTYRNSQSLIDVSEEFIMKNNNQIKKELTSVVTNQIQKPIKICNYPYNLSEVSQILLLEKILKDITKTNDNPNILILGRNNKDIEMFSISNLFDVEEIEIKKGKYKNKTEKFLKYNKNPSLKIRFMTVHKSKGLEADNVILINLINRYDGFPNKMENDPVLKYVINKINENISYPEERRLFYVALTRTKNNVYLITPSKNKSEFVKEIERNEKFRDKIDIFNYEPTEKDINKIKIKKNVNFKTNLKCRKCEDGNVILHQNKNGVRWFSCTNWPMCEGPYIFYNGEINDLKEVKYCPECDGMLVKRSQRNDPSQCFLGCTNYSNGCKHTESLK